MFLRGMNVEEKQCSYVEWMYRKNNVLSGMNVQEKQCSYVEWLYKRNNVLVNLSMNLFFKSPCVSALGLLCGGVCQERRWKGGGRGNICPCFCNFILVHVLHTNLHTSPLSVSSQLFCYFSFFQRNRLRIRALYESLKSR